MNEWVISIIFLNVLVDTIAALMIFHEYHRIMIAIALIMKFLEYHRIKMNKWLVQMFEYFYHQKHHFLT